MIGINWLEIMPQNCDMCPFSEMNDIREEGSVWVEERLCCSLMPGFDTIVEDKDITPGTGVCPLREEKDGSD